MSLRQAETRRGFTLVEVAAATVVLGLLVIPLLGARNRAIASAARSSREFVVAQLAASKLSELSSVPLEDVERSGEFEGAPGYSWEISIEAESGEGGEGVESGEGEAADEFAEPYLYRVKLVISYPDHTGEGAAAKAVVSTLVFKREAKEEGE